ncbi:SUMF1/EgtB/PvdO family nonheme iron enzyme [Pseudanabaena sp. FACHB-1998]|uniref:formylglycine-generating enzyme family protein n=1 Tax=Pseudanabaena sp. FACHB-1998 TaxID=2692858 RepID=UPI002411533C|nr:SUMF1/EgtB/PvdO family nonheme iron enzyme [Pseudanabaena sp. FACHB-1998]
MSGNVWEWCEDVWHDNYNGAPTDGTDWLVGGEQNRRIWRGGSWFNYAFICRSAVRFWEDTDFRDSLLGFRVVI